MAARTAKGTRSRQGAPQVEGTRKVSRTFRLSPDRIAAAQRALGLATATETIEAALDMVIFGEELRAGLRDLRGIHIVPPEGE